MRSLRYVIILIGLSTILFSQDIHSINAKMDSLFAPWNRTDAPGCAIAVIQDSKIVFKKGYGMADLEHDVTITPKTVFYVGSVSKQFVAACIALLAEQGKLSFDDEIHKYIPELPDYDYPITIRQLIHHTSGLRDYLDLGFIGEIDWYDYVSMDEILQLITRQKKLNFEPGTQHSYCNSGYFLLAIIIERISGLSLKQFAYENILQPLGMTSSHFHDDPYHIIKNRAWSYQQDKNGGYKFIAWRFSAVGSGGLYSTVEDMYKWDQNFYHNILGNGDPVLIDTLQKVGLLNNGDPADHYAFAMVNETYNGLKIINHTGSMGGYRACYARFPQQQFSVITMSNSAEFNAKAMSRKVADLFLADQMDFSKKEEKKEFNKPRKNYSADNPDQYAGRYYSAELPATYTVIEKDGVLTAKAVSEFINDKELVPVEKDRFIIDGWIILSFNRHPDSGKIDGFRLDLAGGLQDVVFKSVKDAD